MYYYCELWCHFTMCGICLYMSTADCVHKFPVSMCQLAVSRSGCLQVPLLPRLQLHARRMRTPSQQHRLHHVKTLTCPRLSKKREGAIQTAKINSCFRFRDRQALVGPAFQSNASPGLPLRVSSHWRRRVSCNSCHETISTGQSDGWRLAMDRKAMRRWTYSQPHLSHTWSRFAGQSFIPSGSEPGFEADMQAQSNCLNVTAIKHYQAILLEMILSSSHEIGC